MNPSLKSLTAAVGLLVAPVSPLVTASFGAEGERSLTLSEKKELAQDKRELAKENKVFADSVKGLVRAGKYNEAINLIEADKGVEGRIKAVDAALMPEQKQALLKAPGIDQQKVIELFYSKETLAVAEAVKTLVEAALKPDAVINAKTFLDITKAAKGDRGETSALLTSGPAASQSGLLADLAKIYAKVPKDNPDYTNITKVFFEAFGRFN